MEYRWSGKTFCFKGCYVQLKNVLSRRNIVNLAECIIVAKGTANGADVIVKLRVEVDPIDSLKGGRYREVAKEGCAEEALALQTLQDSGHTPRLLLYDVMTQDESMSLPGGYIRALVMSKVPGQSVLLGLEKHELGLIRVQLAEVLEYIRGKGFCYIDPNPGYLNWDRKGQKLYLVDLEAAERGSDITEKIGPKSDAVKAFMIKKRLCYPVEISNSASPST